MRSFRVVVLLGCFLLPFAAQAQFQEQISVEVVDVPVYVFGPQGPLTNLTRDDFDLFVNGKRQHIDYFDRIDFTVPPASSAEGSQPVVPRDPRNRRLFLLLFDFSSGSPHAIVRARQGAMAMIRDALPSDYFSVATYSTLKGVEFVTPFIADRDATRRAVTALRPSEAHDPLELAISNPERLLLEQNVNDTDLQLQGSRHPSDDRLPAVDDERRAVLGGELGRPRAADDQRTLVDGRRLGPQIRL